VTAVFSLYSLAIHAVLKNGCDVAAIMRNSSFKNSPNLSLTPS